MTLSAVILVKNEEENIREVVHNLQFCDEIIIIDDYSEDTTAVIAKKLGCRVYRRKLNNNYAEQRNFGLEKAKHEWILFVDADERVDNDFKDEVLSIQNDSSFDGYYITRNDWFYGKLLKYGSWTGQHLRLARKSKGKWSRRVHEIWEIDGDVGHLDSTIVHYSHDSVAQFMERIISYSKLHALANRLENKKSSIVKIIAFPLGKFIHNFVLLRGYKDGVHGFIYSGMLSLHSLISWSHLYLQHERT